MGTAVMVTAVMGTYPLRFYTPTKMALASCVCVRARVCEAILCYMPMHVNVYYPDSMVVMYILTASKYWACQLHS